VVSRSSPCIADAALYLTGARYQYNSFYLSDSIGGLYVIQRTDPLLTVVVRRKPGIKPNIIDELGQRAVARLLSPCGLDSLHRLEDEYLQRLLQRPANELFEVELLPAFPWHPVLDSHYRKSDILNKDAPPCEATFSDPSND
jgi:acetolactate decarboxylase